jgi:hypothetical protein
MSYGPTYPPAVEPLRLVEPRRPGTRVTAALYDALVRHVNDTYGAELALARAHACPQPLDGPEGAE